MNKYEIGDILEDTFLRDHRIKGQKIPQTNKEYLRDWQSRLSVIKDIENGEYIVHTPGLMGVLTHLPCIFVDDPINNYILEPGYESLYKNN